MTKKKYFFYVVFKDIPGTYLYFSYEKLAPGDLVTGLFMKKKRIGLVTEIAEKRDENFSVNEATIILKAALSEDNLFLLAKISEYYLCHLGKVVGLFFPPPFWKKIPQIDRERTLVKTNKDVTLRKTQLELLEKIKNKENLDTFLSREEVTKARINNLVKKGVLEIKEGKIKKPHEAKNTPRGIAKKTLNKEQQAAVTEIFNSKQSKSLLFGITGSGKTEVYLQIAKKLKKEGKKCLILVPEIALTPSLVAYFSKDFPNLSIIHSKLSHGARAHEFFRIKNNESDLILGSRLAIFSPVKNIGAIILDEEHEWTYKNDQTPRYDTRKVAEFLANKTGARLIFGSATPSVENFYRGVKKEFNIIYLSKRAKKEAKSLPTLMPKVSLLDMKKERKVVNSFLISDRLLRKMKIALGQNKSVLLFLNRRGFFSSLFCSNCGESMKCPNCDFSLVLHTPKKRQSKLLCHYCGYAKNPITKCDFCDSKNLKYFSAGTQNLYSEIKYLFPKAKIVRIDSDSVSRKEDFSNNLQLMREGKADIFIGTQIIAKGFDVSRISLVGVILADLGLNIPDFRSSERVFNLLTQVAGRTGRGSDQGEVVIQALSPFSPAIFFAKDHNYKKFFLEEIKTRKESLFPPFSEIIKFIFSGKDKKKVFLEAEKFYQYLDKKISKKANSKNNEEIFFAPALIPKKHSKFFFHVFLKAKDLDLILEDIKVPRKAKVDRDPVFMS